MKKIYSPPEMSLVLLLPQDVITASGDDNRLDWDPFEN